MTIRVRQWRCLVGHLGNTAPLLSLRFLSFATPEEAAAERRRRKRRLRIEPPISAFRQPQTSKPKPQSPPNPNAPKLPDSVSLLVGPRLNLHNRILTLIRDNDLTEASLLTRHSIYSNCRPTIFTCNAVLAALLRQFRYSDFLSLHRFVTQAGVIPNLVTYNLLIGAYLDCRKYDIALDHYKLLINDAPFHPSSTTYRILTKALSSSAEHERIQWAISLKDEMLAKGISPDPIVYDNIISGLVKLDDPDRALELFTELKEKLMASSFPSLLPDEIFRSYGSLMKAYFKKGMDEEAMNCLEELLARENDTNSRYRLSAIGYNSVLDALARNNKSKPATHLFERMMSLHSPPKRLTVDLGSFNVMVSMLCSQKLFSEAVNTFRRMDDKKCHPDTSSYNSFIERLCNAGMVQLAEELYSEMGGDKGFNPDEYTYALLVDACIGQNRLMDADAYFNKMVEAGLRPNVSFYNTIIDELVKNNNFDRAKELFHQIFQKELKPDEKSYDILLKGLSDDMKLDDMLEIVGVLLKEDELLLDPGRKELVADALKKEGREEELDRLIEEREKEKEKEKAEALAKKAEAARPKLPIDLSFLQSFAKDKKESTTNDPDPSISFKETDIGEENTIQAQNESGTTDMQVGEGAQVADTTLEPENNSSSSQGFEGGTPNPTGVATASQI